MDSIADGDRYVRGHGWVHFGPFLEAGADEYADEYADEPGTLHHVVRLLVEDGENITDPSKLLDLAGQAIKA